MVVFCAADAQLGVAAVAAGAVDRNAGHEAEQVCGVFVAEIVDLVFIQQCNCAACLVDLGRLSCSNHHDFFQVFRGGIAGFSGLDDHGGAAKHTQQRRPDYPGRAR